MQVQLFPTARTWNRDHEVPSRITDQPFYLALVVALGRTAELIGKQIVTLQLGEGPRPLPIIAAQDLRYRDLYVVVEKPRGLAAAFIASMHTPFSISFSVLYRIHRKP